MDIQKCSSEIDKILSLNNVDIDIKNNILKKTLLQRHVNKENFDLICINEPRIILFFNPITYADQISYDEKFKLLMIKYPLFLEYYRFPKLTDEYFEICKIAIRNDWNALQFIE